ncbi:MAG TPA: hypothetical protein VEW03_00960 [Longimicrobiaceae bacterium]|nr:hypothetical protein [Longimicrobiaceae bacterium]
MTAPLERIAAVVGAVARQALADRGAHRVALLYDGGPEAGLAARLLAGQLGDGAVERVGVAEGEVEPLLHPGGPVDRARLAEELRRLRARCLEGAVPAHPANKTALLLGGELPPEPLLPLGDLWATEVAALADGWSAPDAVLRLADEAGGIEALDAALRQLVDGRRPDALDALPFAAREGVRRALAAGRAARLFPRIVPKLGVRTLGLDLLE